MESYEGNNAQTPAGWYGDPLKRGYERYWDGSEWSDEVRVAQPVPLPSLPERPEPAVPQGGATAVVPGQDGPPVAAGPDRVAGAAPEQSPHWQQPATDTDAAEPVESQLAAPGKRLLAVAIDAVICNLVAWLATMGVWLSLMRRMEPLMGDPANPTIPDQAAMQSVITSRDMFFILMGWSLVSILYHTVLVGWRGATIGKLVAGIRVVPTADPLRTTGPGWGAAFVRALAWSLLAQWPWILYLGILFVASSVLVLINPKRQTWPDLLARTLVVNKPHAKVTSHFNPR